MRMTVLYKPFCVSNYWELHVKHGKLHAHAHSLRVAIERTSPLHPFLRFNKKKANLFDMISIRGKYRLFKEKQWTLLFFSPHNSLFFEKPPNHCGLTEMKDDFSKSVSVSKNICLLLYSYCTCMTVRTCSFNAVAISSL